MQRQLSIPSWQISETRGKTLFAFGRQITPIGRAIQVSWSGGSFAGGFTWNRPLAIEVREGDMVRRLPIQNVTRRAILGLALAGLAVVALASSLRRRGNS
jgi:hypothetical protein